MAGDSATYYKNNPDALAKKRKYNRWYKKHGPNAKEAQRKVVEANRYNRENGTYGNGDGKDYDHSTGKLEPAKENRGRAEGSRVRGSKRRKVKKSDKRLRREVRRKRKGGD